MTKHFQIHIHYKGKDKRGGSIESYFGFKHSSESGRMDVSSVYDYARELAREQAPDIIVDVVLCNVTVIDTWETE